ncbi:MAG: hypothetical protein H6R04_1218 [Burkholderiaceae bacterium]|nr:hypothetical protein [Burkholderiaceae bacterium]
MNQQHYFNDGIRTVTAPHSRRQDLETAKIVSQGILYQKKLGTDFAAAYMSNRGVKMDVALRVLSRPHLRRQ